MSPTDPLGAVTGTPSLLCPPTAHTLVKHSRKSFGAIRKVWSQHRLPQQASFLAVVVWALAGLVRELGALICKAEQLGCQSQAPLAGLLLFLGQVGWEARGGEGAALRTQVAAHSGSCGQVRMTSGGLDSVPWRT